MPQHTTRSSGAPSHPSKSARQTRSTISQGQEYQTLVSGLDSNSTTENSKPPSQKANRSTLSHKTKSKKNAARSQSGEGSSEGDDAEEPPDSSDGQDEDEQPAVIAPSCDSKKKGHKAGRNDNRAQIKKRETPERGHKVNAKDQASKVVTGRRENPVVDRNQKNLMKKSLGDDQVGGLAGDSQQLQGIQSIDTDDDDYAAVDEISESDEGDDELERLEEKMIIASYNNIDAVLDFPTASWEPPSPWTRFGDDHLFLADESFLGDYVHEQVDGEDTLLPSNFDFEQAETPRRVHFADEVDDTSTGSSSSETESNQFSDTFLEQDRLAPSLLHRIEQDSADEDQSLSENEWDVRQDGLLEYEHYGLDDGDDSITSEGSDYETDEGETTDEDLPPPTTVAHPGSILQEDSSDSSRGSRSHARHRKFPRRHSLNGPVTPRTASQSVVRQTGPRMGFWVADPTKATAYIGPTGKLMLIQPARKSTRLANTSLVVDSSISSQQSLYELLNDSEIDTSTPASPMLSTDVNLMMSGLFHGGPGNEYLRGGQVMGPPEAFYPFRSVGTDGRITEELDDDDEDSDEAMLDVGDFIDFGGSSTDEDDDHDVNEDTKGKSKAVISSKQSLLDHLDGSNVTAFRRNTTRVNAYLKLPKHREFMPFSPPGTTNAVRYGKQSEMSAPIAPLRKRKRDNSNPTVESNRGNTVQRKLVNAHKRSKSLF